MTTLSANYTTFQNMLYSLKDEPIIVGWITGMGAGLPGILEHVGTDYIVVFKENGTRFNIPFASILHVRRQPS